MTVYEKLFQHFSIMYFMQFHALLACIDRNFNSETHVKNIEKKRRYT
jgi:hypothetical protein